MAASDGKGHINDSGRVLCLSVFGCSLRRVSVVCTQSSASVWLIAADVVMRPHSPPFSSFRSHCQAFIELT